MDNQGFDSFSPTDDDTSTRTDDDTSTRTDDDTSTRTDDDTSTRTDDYTSSYSTICNSSFSRNHATEAATQTDGLSVTIRSWMIQRTAPQRPSSSSRPVSGPTSLYRDSSNLYVLETHSVGFNAATQTLHRELYCRSKSEMTSIVAAWRIVTILIPSLSYLILYFLDQLLDVIVCTQFLKEGCAWWSVLGFTFLLVPSVIISIFSYGQLVVPDIASVKPMQKNIGRILCFLQLTPYYILGRKVWWGLKAWSWTAHRDERLRNESMEIWKKAEVESDSTTVKLFQSLLESVPQLSLQSYVLLHKLSCYDAGTPTPAASSALWLSVFVNLLSASSGLASSQSQGAFERMAGSIAIFITLGSRVMVCGGIGTLSPALWIVPVVASFIIGFATKISESLETTLSGHAKKLQKYVLEAFVMASVSPPYDTTGLFCSTVYVLAAFIFFMDFPSSVVHILAPIVAVSGQVLWLLLGFCLLNKTKVKPNVGIPTHGGESIA